jgi:hypothetical protein
VKDICEKSVSGDDDIATWDASAVGIVSDAGDIEVSDVELSADEDVAVKVNANGDAFSVKSSAPIATVEKPRRFRAGILFNLFIWH